MRVYSVEKVKKKGPFHVTQIIQTKRILGPSGKRHDRLAKQAAQNLEEAAAKLRENKEAAEKEEGTATSNSPDGVSDSATAVVLVPKKKKRKPPKSYDMFMDDITTNTFFRRLEWTVDGSFLLTPAAVYRIRNKQIDSNSLRIWTKTVE